MNQKQKALRTKLGMATNDIESLELAYKNIPLRYKRLRRMINHNIEKLRKKIKDTESKLTYLGD